MAVPMTLRTMSCTLKPPEDPGWEPLRRSSSMGREDVFKKNGQENTSQGSTVPKDLPLICHQNLVSHGLRKPDCNSTSHLRRGQELEAPAPSVQEGELPLHSVKSELDTTNCAITVHFSFRCNRNIFIAENVANVKV